MSTARDTRQAIAAFDPRMVGAIIVIGIISFVALLVLLALGPQLPRDGSAAGSALSRDVTGFAGIVEVAKQSGIAINIRREVIDGGALHSKKRYGKTGDVFAPLPALLIVTPSFQTSASQLDALLDAIAPQPVLVILPKWLTTPHRTKRGWAGEFKTIPEQGELLSERNFGITRFVFSSSRSSSPPASSTYGSETTIITRKGYTRFAAPLPEGSWTIDGSDLVPLMERNGGSLLARVEGSSRYILTEPDLLNNHALRSRQSTEAAFALIDAVASDAPASSIAVDVTLSDFGAERSLWSYIFLPPFIGITICLIAAGFLSLWRSAVRFGRALQPARGIPISKTALINNSAELIVQAGRERDGAEAYLLSLRHFVAGRLHAPKNLTGEALNRWIDERCYKQPGQEQGRQEQGRQEQGRQVFSALSRQFLRARSSDELLKCAQSLHDMGKGLLRDY